MKKLFTPIKVGIVTLVAIAGFVYALRSVQEGALSSGDTYQVSAVLGNVLGIAKRSRVVMAGIEVGYIEGIELRGSKARLRLRIRKDVPLYRDAVIAKISESLLGDKLIDLSPGGDLEHPIPDGGEILQVYEEKDMTDMFRELNEITRDIHGVTASLNKTLGQLDRDDSLNGVMQRMIKISENVAELTQKVNDSFQMGSTKVQQILDDVAGVTGGTRGRYAEILENVRDVTVEAKTMVANVNDIIGRGGTDWKESVGGLKETLQQASRSLENLDNITRKINEGQGTLGRLVNDDKILAKAEGVLDDAASFTSKLARLQTVIDLRSEYHVKKSAAKNYLALKLVPKSDKFYLMEVIDDPRGSVTVKETCNDNTCSSTTKSITIENKFKFSLQFEKRFFWLGLRFGIIEGTGGVGTDWYFFKDDLEFKFDLFQFGKNEYGLSANPRFKAMVFYRPTFLANHIYISAGGDDFFNRQAFDYFFGLGISFNDEDLKAIFTTTGIPKGL